MDAKTRILLAGMICGLYAAMVCAGTTRPSAGASDFDDLAGLEPNPATRQAPASRSTTGLSEPEQEAPELLLFKDMPVVVAAGKRVQTQGEAAASVTVITENEIELFNYHSLAEALRNQRSFNLYTDGLNWFAGVRGFMRPGEWNARMLVTVDGRPTNDVTFGQTNLDQDFDVPMEMIKRIEVVRGPGSALYGSNADFAVVNVVTKDGADLNGALVKVEGGSKTTGRVLAAYGTRTSDGWDIIGSVTGYGSQGDTDIGFNGVTDPAHNYGHVRDHDYGSVESAFFKAKNGDFTIQMDYGYRQQDNRNATYLVSFFNPGSEDETRNNVSFRFDHQVADGQSLHAMAYYGYYGYHQEYTIDANGTTPITPYGYTTEAHDAWLGQDVYYDWQATRMLHLLLGADATESLYANQNDFDTTGGNVLDIGNSFSTYGMFAEAELKATDWLNLVGGVRWDQTQRLGPSISPRFGAILSPDKQDTIKALYGRAYRNPNLYEMFYDAPGNDANPSLRPEIVDTYELVWDRQFADGWGTTLDGYLWKMSDALTNVTQPDGNIEVENDGNIWAHGAEAEIHRRWNNNASLRVYGSYTWDTQFGQQLDYSPEWICGVAAAVPIIGRNTFLSVNSQIVGPMKDDLNEFTQPTYITDVVLTSRDIVKGWTVQAGVYNLFGNYAHLPYGGAAFQYQPTLNYPLPEFMLSVSARF